MLVDDDGMVSIPKSVYFCAGPPDVDMFENDRTSSPPVVAVIDLTGRQGHPSDMDPKMDPPDPPRIPGHSNVRQGMTESNPNAHNSRGPIPDAINQDPVAIVMGDVPKRLRWNPAVVIVPDRPSAHGKWGPSQAHVNRTPEIAVCTFVVDFDPSAIPIEDISFVTECRR
jgi:hypothetical protein